MARAMGLRVSGEEGGEEGAEETPLSGLWPGKALTARLDWEAKVPGLDRLVGPWEPLCSPPFGHSKAPGLRCTLELYPGGYKAGRDVAAFLHVAGFPDGRSASVTARAEVAGGFVVKELVNRPFPNGGWGWQSFVKAKDVAAALDEDSLRIHVSVRWAWAEWMLPKPAAEPQDALGPFKRFLLQDALADVWLRWGHVSVPAHKVVLASRSPVLAALLTSPDHRGLRHLTVQEVGKDWAQSFASLRHFLSFLYTGQLEGEAEGEAAGEEPWWEGLLELGQRYEVEGLVGRAEWELRRRLGPTSLVETAVAAERLGRASLLAACRAFVANAEARIPRRLWAPLAKEHPTLALHLTPFLSLH